EARMALARGDGEAAFAAAERAVARAHNAIGPALDPYRRLLERVYVRQLGDETRPVGVARVPSVLDPRTAFLLSRVDGNSSIEDLRAVAGMDGFESARLISLLLRDGILMAR